MTPGCDGFSGATVTLEDILALIYRKRDIDFRRYRRSTIERRMNARMRLVGTETYDDYLRRLSEDPDEVDRLIGYMTIKVSQFFRNAEVYNLLREVALPEFSLREQGQPLRFWSAGCGHGEEAYSLAILLGEVDPEGVRAGSAVYASDVDDRALDNARRGQYSVDALANLPSELVRTHFTAQQGRRGPIYTIADGPRSRVKFFHHDLTSGAEPEAGLRFDLICCRNVLIYFDQAMQERVQHLLFTCLAPGGYLCLGEAERLTTTLDRSFEVIDRRARLYRLAVGGARER